MMSPVGKIRTIVSQILEERKSLLLLACKQRAKFEGWLKFEIACALEHDPDFLNVIIEDNYPNFGRSDLSFIYNAEKYFIEMKTANTNWREEGLETKTRPITKNINGIIRDIEILEARNPSAHGIMIFIIFPIPLSLLENYPLQLDFHLNRIENNTKLIDGSLKKNMTYVSISEIFGTGLFVEMIV